MRKYIFIVSITFLALSIVNPAFAQTATTTNGSVSQIVSFIQSVVQVLITLAGTISVGFIVWGGIGYITSSGHPDNLEKSKKTIFYAAVGLAVVLGAFVLSGIISQLATSAFGMAH